MARKIGEDFLRAMGVLGIHEFRNFWGFEGNIQDDIRRVQNPQQEMNHYHHQAPQQDQQQDQTLEQGQER